MNRLEEILSKIEHSFKTIELTKEKYNNCIKGEIYFSTINYHTKLVKSLQEKLRNFGKTHIQEYTVKYRSISTSQEYTKKIQLDSNITADEIATYFSMIVPDIKVISVTATMIVVTYKFPSKL